MTPSHPSHPSSHPSSSSSYSSVPVKSFYLSRTVLESLWSLPAQIWFAITGLFGFAHFARGIVRAIPKRPGQVTLRRSGRAGSRSNGLVNRVTNAETNRGDEGDEGEEKVSINQWIEENVPSLKGGFTPSWWLPNGHLQTFYIVGADFTKVDQIEYERTYLRLPDNGTIALDFAPKHHAELDPTAPTVVVSHGLTGGSHESYVRNLLAWVIKPVSEGGMGGRGIVVNFRGCAGTPLTSCQFYSAGTTVDLHTALHFIRNRYPSSPLHGAGFSLGASVLARYLGESGSSSFLSTGLVLGCPWDLVAMARRLEDGWFRSRVYSSTLAQNLLALFNKHDNVDKRIFREKGSRMEPWIGEIDALNKRSRRGGKVRLREVDDVMVTKIGGPEGKGTWPFETAQDYYKWASPNKLIKNIKVPVLAINAFDDPVVAGDALPIPEFQSSSHVYAAITGGGGHLGWFDGPFFSRTESKRRWVLKPMSEFLTAAKRGVGQHGAKVEVVHEEGWEWVVGGELDREGHGEGKVGWRILKEGEVVVGQQGQGTLQGL